MPAAPQRASTTARTATDFTQLGNAFTMKKDWQFFTGYRYAVFNYATQSLGGSVKVASFDITKE